MLNNIMSTCHICQNVKSSNTACRGGGSLGTWMWRGNRLALGPRGGAMSKRGVPWAFLILTAPELSAFDWCVIWHPTATWSEYLDMQASHLVVSEFWTIWLIFLNRCCSYIKGGGGGMVGHLLFICAILCACCHLGLFWAGTSKYVTVVVSLKLLCVLWW